MLSKALLRYETVGALSTTREGNGARRGEEAYELCWHCLYTLLSAERESTTAPPESDSHDNQGGAGGVEGLDRKGSRAPLS